MNEQQAQAQNLWQQYAIQAALQDQAVAGQSVPYAPQLQEQVAQSQAVLVTETNPNKVLKEIELALRNVDVRPDGTEVQLGTPIMNDVGINRMKFIMRGIINQNTILSHLEDKEISRLIINKADNIVDDLTLNWREYDIDDKIMLDHIVDVIVYPAFFALKRALEQNEKNWLGKISVENISGAPRIQAPKKGGFWEKFKL